MDTQNNPKGYKLSAWLDRATATKLKIYAAIHDITISDAVKNMLSDMLKDMKIDKGPLNNLYIKVSDTIHVKDELKKLVVEARAEHEKGKTKSISTPKALKEHFKEIDASV